ncbi:MAG: hypothetical protein MR559_08480 [Prevotella sp.]|nr:hypothetical protein [Prevotella sp.]MDD5784510.1 hypothetical protein [Prevotella sp.]MDD6863027.1 hypothetical protein [Prevotella sp.]
MQIDEEYFKSDDFKELLKSYEMSVKSGQPIFMDVDDLTDLIDYYNLMHMDKEAEETANYALSLYPGASGPITYLVRRFIDRDDLSAAEELAEEVEDKDIEYKFIKAEIYLAQNQGHEANDILEDAIRCADEDDVDNCILDALNIFVDYGYFDLAKEWLDKVKDIDSEDFYEMSIKIHSAIGNVDKAEKIINKLIDSNPYNEKYWNMLSYVQFVNGKFADALTSSEYSLAASPNNPGGLSCKAQALVKLFQYKEAIKYYSLYFEIYPLDANSLVQIGFCHINLSNYQQAINAFSSALANVTDDPELQCTIYDNLSLAYSHLGEKEKALEMINKLKTYTNYVDHLHIMLLEGYILLEAGDKDGLKILSELLDECSYDALYVLKVSVVLYENHLWKSAYTLMQTKFPFDTKDYGHSYFALYCFELGKDEEFLKYLKMGVELNPEEAELSLRHLFPEGMRPENYYEFIINLKNKYKK